MYTDYSRLPKWENFHLAREIESSYPQLTANFRLLSSNKQTRFLQDRRKELREIGYALNLLIDKYNEIYKTKYRGYERGRIRELGKVPTEWLSNISHLINEFDTKRKHIDNLLTYLNWIHNVSVRLSIWYEQYCKKIGVNLD